jgi:hypothetical protein
MPNIGGVWPNRSGGVLPPDPVVSSYLTGSNPANSRLIPHNPAWPNPAPVHDGVEHVIVVSFNATTGESRLWLNTASESDPYISDTNAGAIGTILDSIALRQDFISGPVADNEIAVNGIGMATTFDEAYAASMVPEPASLGLIALGGLAMLRRR